ncbi:Pr6Pr family membrane protein [Streptomyces sp. NPDC048272]|uniref:Pr6Pr family membrane protein n=1 Tax=Streptomyces sp. NPDC048272 TaxID=3154616 RepID=UPI003421DD8F
MARLAPGPRDLRAGPGRRTGPGRRARYPYPFVDVARYGYGQVALNALILSIAFFALGLALVVADRFRPGLRPGRARENRISSPADGPLK